MLEPDQAAILHELVTRSLYFDNGEVSGVPSGFKLDEVAAALASLEDVRNGVGVGAHIAVGDDDRDAQYRGAIEMIADERNRQQASWGDDHDDDHTHGELAVHGAELAVQATDERLTTIAHSSDAWGLVAKHRHDGVRSLTIAGALIAAELDRILRKIRSQPEAPPPAAEPVKLPVFPDIGCEGECGFERRGVGWQCVDGTACKRYVHPGDEHFEALEIYHRKMTEPEGAQE